MYKLSRLALVMSIGAVLYGCAVLVVLTAPGSVILLGLVVLVQLARRARHPPLNAHGTARLADANDVRTAGMFDARDGFILGRLPPPARPLVPALHALFNRRIPARGACEQFLRALRGRPSGGELVRLRNSVHTTVFAPTGAGKGVSCILPFLFECPDTCVVIDFTGSSFGNAPSDCSVPLTVYEPTNWNR